MALPLVAPVQQVCGWQPLPVADEYSPANRDTVNGSARERGNSRST